MLAHKSLLDLRVMSVRPYWSVYIFVCMNLLTNKNVKMTLFYMEEDKKRFEKRLRGRAITSWYRKL